MRGRGSKRGKSAGERACGIAASAGTPDLIERRNDSFVHNADLVVSASLVASVDLISSCRNRFYIFSSLPLHLFLCHVTKKLSYQAN
jgi:hypothetical protein